MVDIFMQKAEEIRGSGWAWLVFNKQNGSLDVKMTQENDRIQDEHPHLVPLLNIDLWEHAYFNEYESRARYLQEIWRIIDWKRVAYRYENAKM